MLSRLHVVSFQAPQAFRKLGSQQCLWDVAVMVMSMHHCDDLISLSVCLWVHTTVCTGLLPSKYWVSQHLAEY